MRNRTPKHCTVALLTAGALLGLTGCGVLSPQEQSPVVRSDDFLKRFNAVCDPGALIPLSSLTTVEWDEAFVFPEGTSPEQFETTTGNPARDWAVSGRFTPGEYILVLQKDGEFVEIIQFISGEIHGNREHPSWSYDADVLVRMTQTDHGCYGELVPLQSTEQGD